VADQVTGEGMLSLKNRGRLSSATFYVRKMKYSIGQTQGYLAICLNEKERQAIHKRRYDEIDQAFQ
jgi:hypothetical protein